MPLTRELLPPGPGISPRVKTVAARVQERRRARAESPADSPRGQAFDLVDKALATAEAAKAPAVRSSPAASQRVAVSLGDLSTQTIGAADIALVAPGQSSEMSMHLQSLQRDLVAIENARTISEQAHARELSARNDDILLLAQQVSLLKCQLETAQEQLKGAQQSELECRNRAIAAENRLEEARGSILVFQARLDASAKREMTLQTSSAKLQAVHNFASLALADASSALPSTSASSTLSPAVAFSSASQQPIAECRQHLDRIGALEEKATALDQSVLRAEWARVEAERRALDLEDRLAHSRAEAESLKARVQQLAEAVDAKDRLLASAAGKPIPTQPKDDLKLLQSRLDFAERATLTRFRESAADFDAILHMVQSRLDGSKQLDMQRILQSKPLPANDAEHLAAYAQDLKSLASQVKTLLLDRLADEEHSRLAQQEHQCHLQ